MKVFGSEGAAEGKGTVNGVMDGSCSVCEHMPTELECTTYLTKTEDSVAELLRCCTADAKLSDGVC